MLSGHDAEYIQSVTCIVIESYTEKNRDRAWSLFFAKAVILYLQIRKGTLLLEL